MMLIKIPNKLEEFHRNLTKLNSLDYDHQTIAK